MRGSTGDGPTDKDARKHRDASARFLIIDACTLSRTGLVRLLNESFPEAEIREASRFEAGFLIAKAARFDVVSLDVDMRDVPLEALLCAIGGMPSTRFVVFTESLDRRRLHRLARHRRLAAIIEKSTSLRGMTDIIRLVAGGERYIPALLDNDAAERKGRQRTLTHRQREVLEGLAAGLSSSEIAERLGISVPMVKAHIARACDTLGARNRTMAVAIAGRRGLLD